MWNAGPDDAQTGIKIARRSINNLRYTDDTTVLAVSKEELKSLLMKVKEESEQAGLKLNIHSEGCLFTLLIVSFDVQKLLRLIRSHLFIFAFISNILGGEDNSKWSNWQTTHLENIQATPTAQLQKNKWPNQKMGQRTK